MISDAAGVQSGWLLTFYQRMVFFGIVFEDAACNRRVGSGEASRIDRLRGRLRWKAGLGSGLN